MLCGVHFVGLMSGQKVRSGKVGSFYVRPGQDRSIR